MDDRRQEGQQGVEAEAAAAPGAPGGAGAAGAPEPAGGDPAGSAPDPAAPAPVSREQEERRAEADLAADRPPGQAGGGAGPVRGNGGAGREAEDQPGLVDWVYGVIFTPRPTFARLAAMERPPLGLLLTVAVIVTALSGLVQGAAVVRDLAVPVVPGEEPLLPPDVARSPGMVLAMGVTAAVISVVALFVGAGFLHLVADLVGGRGTGVHLLAAIALGSLPPNLIGIPLEALASRLGEGGAGLRNLGAVAIIVWSVVLTYHALRATKGLSRSDALIVLFVPGLILTGLAVLVIVALVAAAAAGLAGM
ncbi:hypothetical protein Tmar_2336 [Thermaerobacter marianensis DSM 12885]|uniref:Yip1 domain-containing protein n=1 Tax=Thermaerobacter marianensis (strain ATCC 700841 / DSM 12885 / JCM 10246 / 7p75a) TaxID=644966 RepID=E6SLH1_THEM7|nr:Yip1 family protein [Thermaerobacter marianensis]ADU52413.1 hypothetical protein Tmar_2336 [Thermaerobacter marianensis DSM 12885]